MTVHFLGGLPRSNSTILTALLAQNPEFHTTPTSPLVELLTGMVGTRSNSSTCRALDKDTLDRSMLGAMRGVVRGYFADTAKGECFDKSRGWLGKFDLLLAMYPQPKVIVPIRDIRGCVASLEKLHRGNPTLLTPLGKDNKGITLQNRVEGYLSDSPLGNALEMLLEAHQRGFLSSMLVVRAEDLGADPERELKRVYDYCGLPWFEGHTYEGVVGTTFEHDHIHAPYGEHEVQGSVSAPPTDWDDILGEHISSDIKARGSWFYELFYPDR